MFKWKIHKFFKETFLIGSGKTSMAKIRLFVYSLLVGFAVLVTILFAVSGINPFNEFASSLNVIFNQKSAQDNVLVSIAILGLAGIAVAIGFKTGLFNIGVSGQMIFGGLLASYFALEVGQNLPMGVGQMVILLIAVIGASLFAAIAGFLKSFFGIHEVVSTILLNWIAFFIMQGVVKEFLSPELKIGNNSVEFGANYLFAFNIDGTYYGGLIALSLLILTAFIIWITIYKTSFGQKLIIVGKNKDAAIASGLNVKVISTLSMIISGSVAGVLAVVVYFISDKHLSQSLVDVIPAAGFDGIAIAILAFSNPLAILPTALIFGSFVGLIEYSFIDGTFLPLVTGILLFTAAINIIFAKFNFGKLFLRLFVPKFIAEGKKKIKYINEKTNQKFYEEYVAHKILWKRNYKIEKIKNSKYKNEQMKFKKIRKKIIRKKYLLLISIINRHKKALFHNKIENIKKITNVKQLNNAYQEELDQLKQKHKQIIKQLRRNYQTFKNKNIDFPKKLREEFKFNIKKVTEDHVFNEKMIFNKYHDQFDLIWGGENGSN